MTNSSKRVQQRITVNSLMVQLANANSPPYKIEQKRLRVGLQSSTTYQNLNIQKSKRSLVKEKIFPPTKFIRTSWRKKKVNVTNDYNSFRHERVMCDNNTVKSHHVNCSDFLKKTWLSSQDLHKKKILFICNKVFKDLKVNKL